MFKITPKIHFFDIAIDFMSGGNHIFTGYIPNETEPS